MELRVYDRSSSDDGERRVREVRARVEEERSPLTRPLPRVRRRYTRQG